MVHAGLLGRIYAHAFSQPTVCNMGMARYKDRQDSGCSNRPVTQLRMQYLMIWVRQLQPSRCLYRALPSLMRVSGCLLRAVHVQVQELKDARNEMSS